MKKKLIAGLTAGLLMIGGIAQAENEATFDFGTGVLNIPKVAVGSDYYNVTMLQQGEGLNFSVTGASVITTDPVPTDTGTVMLQGREWQKSGSQAAMTWDAANSYCANLSEGGHDDWFLPAIETLRSLIVCSNGTQVTYGPDNATGGYFCGEENTNPYTSPTIAPAFSSFASGYWSYTTYAGNHSYAWGVGFASGNVFLNNKLFNEYVLCVRGGQ